MSRMSSEEIEIRIWAFIVVILSTMLFVIALGVLWAVAFEEQKMELAPIDSIFLEILKAVAYMSIGTLRMNRDTFRRRAVEPRCCCGAGGTYVLAALVDLVAMLREPVAKGLPEGVIEKHDFVVAIDDR